MPENPEAFISALNAGNGASIANGTDSSVDAMRRQIQFHEQVNGNKTALDKLVEVAWHQDGKTLTDLESLQTQISQSPTNGNRFEQTILDGQITAATRADQSAMQTQNSVDYYAGSFLKAVPLFAGRSNLLMAASVGFNALDAVKMKDTGGQVVEDLALGAAKGFALKKTFDFLSPQQLNIGAEGSAVANAAAFGGAGLKGMAMGSLSRLYDTGLNRQTWTDKNGELDVTQGLSRTVTTSFDKNSLLLDGALFMGGHALFAGMSTAADRAVQASPALQKLESSSLGSFVKDSKILPTAANGATFGFASGAVGEWSRERQSGDNLDLSKIVRSGAYQALTSAAAGATGAGLMKIPMSSIPTALERSTESAPQGQQLAFAGHDAVVAKFAEKPEDSIWNREIPTINAALPRVQEIAKISDAGLIKPELPNLNLETFSLSDLTTIKDGAKPLTKEEWQSALRDGKFAIMLSGGGQQGYHHLGFLAAVEEMGLRPLQVTGVSAGSTFRALDIAKDQSLKWDATNPSDREILPGLIKALTPGSADSAGRHQETAPDRADLKQRLLNLQASSSSETILAQDKPLANFLNAAKQSLASKHVLDDTFDTSPKGRPQIDLTDMAWNSAKPYRTLFTGKELGDGAMHGLPRVDLTELWWNNPFNVWRYALGAQVPAGIPHITTWDGSQLDMMPAFKALDKRLDLQGHNSPESSFLAYDVENGRVVNFQGGQSRYNIATALTASTAVNYDGKGVRPVDAIINGQHSRLVDLGVVDEGRYNSPTAHLPVEMPAIVSQLPRPASPRRPNDMVIDFASGERPPFPLVSDNDVLQMFTHGYVETMRDLAPYVTPRNPSENSDTLPTPALQSLAVH